MKKMSLILIMLIVPMAVFLTTAAQANPISEIGPFIGTLQEDWEFPWGGGWTQYPDHSVLTIMGGAATITDEQLSTWSYGNSTVGTSGLSVPVHGNQGMGENTTGLITLEFVNPVSKFGGYFQAYTYDYVNPVQISFTFYGASDNYLDTKTYGYLHANGDGVMDWHGWSFDTPVAKVTWSETGGANDYLQAVPVPEPVTLLFLGATIVSLSIGSRKFRKE